VEGEKRGATQDRAFSVWPGESQLQVRLNNTSRSPQSRISQSFLCSLTQQAFRRISYCPYISISGTCNQRHAAVNPPRYSGIYRL